MVLPGDESTDISPAFVSDVVDGLVRLMAAPPETWLLNIGSDQPARLVFVAELLSELAGSAAHPFRAADHAGTPGFRISHAREAVAGCRSCVSGRPAAADGGLRQVAPAPDQLLETAECPVLRTLPFGNVLGACPNTPATFRSVQCGE